MKSPHTIIQLSLSQTPTAHTQIILLTVTSNMVRSTTGMSIMQKVRKTTNTVK